MASALKMCFHYNNLVEGIRFLDFVLNVIYIGSQIYNFPIVGILTVQVYTCTKNNGDMQVTLHGFSLFCPFSNR